MMGLIATTITTLTFTLRSNLSFPSYSPCKYELKKYFFMRILLIEAKLLKFYYASPLMSDFGLFIPLCVFCSNGYYLKDLELGALEYWRPIWRCNG